MPTVGCGLIAATTIGLLAGVVAPLYAQDEADAARFRLGAVSLSPTIRITNVGHDSNVLNVAKDDHPTSDMTATASPSVEGWLRTPRLRANGRSRLDMYYFRDLPSYRAVDNEQVGRLEMYLNRVMPWVSGTFAKTRHRQNLEIDAIAERRDDMLEGGTLVRLTKKTSAGAYVARSHVEYEPQSLFRGTDLARSLNHTGSLEAVAVRYAATPLTTFALSVEQRHDRFAFSSGRDSDSVRVYPAVEFKPLALISGRAAIGFRKVRFRGGNHPDFNGTVASVDLHYTWRSRTQIEFTAQRDLEYSYADEQIDYLLTGFATSLTQRFFDRWDAVGSVGRYQLAYRSRGALDVLDPGLPQENVIRTGLSLGYNVGRTRVGFDVDHQNRTSDVALGREYDRLRIGTSVSYVF
jgi:putative beta-barrel porin BBP2